MKDKPSYEELEQKVSELEKKLEHFKIHHSKANNNIKSVIAPEAFQPLFDSAQETVAKYFQEIIMDPSMGMIEIGGERYTLVRAESLSFNLLNTIKDLYSDGNDEKAFSIGKNILFDISHMIGMSDARNFHKKMNLKDPITKLSAGPVHFSYTGWALVEILPESKPSPDKNFFLIYHHPFSFESDAWGRASKKSDSSVCIMNAGYSSGWCEESFGIPLTAVEIACKAKGDENCTFIMAHPEKIEDYLKQHMPEMPAAKRKKIVYEIPTFFERKKMEDALRESEKRFRDISYSMADWIWETDKKGKYRFVSGNVKQSLGYKPKELIGKMPFDLMPEDEAKRVKRIYDRISVEKKNIEDLENWYLTRRGENVCLLINGVPMLNEKRELTGYRGISKDITVSKRIAEELKKAKENAEMANKVKSEFIANMSHEIRTPMNAIIALSDLLLDTGLTREQWEFAKTVQDSATSLLALLNDILDFSKMEAGKLELELFDFDLWEAMEKYAGMFAPESQEKGIAFSYSIDPGIPRLLRGDLGRLRQVLINLTGNALKFTEQGDVSVHAALIEENNTNVKIKFTVMDTGIGIPDNFINRLFDSFSQLDASVTRKYGGTGLGLTIAKQLTELMGGEIGAESQPGKGATFWFTTVCEKQPEGLYRKEYKKPPVPAITGDSAEKNQKREPRILLAEDNSINRKVVLSILNKHGYQADVGVNGLEALAALERNTYDLVLMDIQMPEMDGVTATKEIRNPKSGVLDHDVPIVAMTAHAMPGDKETFLEAGMNGYISKPVRSKKLIDAIEKYSK